MTELPIGLFAAVAATGSMAGVLIGAFLWRWIGLTGTVTKLNARAILQQGASDEWNEFRALHPHWSPRFHWTKITGKRLDGTNLSHAVLTNTSFDSCDLSRSDFSNSVLNDVSFFRTILVGSRFDGATTDGVVDLREAVLDSVLLLLFKNMGADVSLAHVTDDPILPDATAEELRTALASDAAMLNYLSQEQIETLLRDLLQSQGVSLQLARDSEGVGTNYDLLATLSTGRAIGVIETIRTRSPREFGASRVRQAARLARRLGLECAILVANGQFTTEATRAAKAYGVGLVSRDRLFRAVQNQALDLSELSSACTPSTATN